MVNDPDTNAARAPLWRSLARAALVGLVLLNLAAFLVRARFVATSGAMAATTGFEEFCLYNIWKVGHGLPLYEWPQHEPYLLTLYNFGFYWLYAAWARLWHADGAALVGAVRFFTPLWALAGWWLQVRLVRRLVPEVRRADAWVWGLSFLAWFGTCFNAWTTVTARPDIPAAVLALAGFTVALRARESRATAAWGTAALLFFAAWSCKQSVVWVLAGTALHLLVTRRWREMAALTIPFAGLAVAAIVAGGEIYRYNLFTVPRIFRWSPDGSAVLLAQAVALNLFFWWFAGHTIWQAIGRRRDRQAVKMETGAVEERWRATMFAAVPAVSMGAVQLSYHGSSTNNILEGFLMVALLGTAAWIRAWREPGRVRSLRVGACLLVAMAPVPALQLGLAARAVPDARVGRVSVGNLVKLTATQCRQRREFAAWLGTLPRPLWIRDAMLQLPWFATDNRYPAYPVDYEFDQDAIGLLDGGGLASLIRQRRFASLLLRPGDALIRPAEKSGYFAAPVPDAFAHLPTEYGIDRPGPLLFVRGASDHPAPGAE